MNILWKISLIKSKGLHYHFKQLLKPLNPYVQQNKIIKQRV